MTTVPLPIRTEERESLNEGAVFENPYPFVREEFSGLDIEGPYEVKSWRPGVRFVSLPPYGEDVEGVADGIGRQILTVVATFKPGRYPNRVFYIRQWVSPDGKRFGKSRLRIATEPQFRALTRGYRHEWKLAQAEQAAA